MRRIMGVFGVAALALGGAAQAQDIDPGGDADTHIQPAAPRPPKPIERKKLDEAVAKVFAEADTNHDGLLTLDEFNANIAARKAVAIRDRFDRIDTDRNQQLSLAEFTAWQLSLGTLALSDQQGGTQVAEALPVHLGKDREAEVLEHLIRPVSATTIVECNTDYDAGCSLAELTEYEHKDFDAGDLNHDGWLTYDEVNLLEETWGRRAAGGPGAPGGEPRGPGGGRHGGMGGGMGGGRGESGE